MGKGALKRTLEPSFVFKRLTPSLVGIGTHGGCQKCIGMGSAYRVYNIAIGRFCRQLYLVQSR